MPTLPGRAPRCATLEMVRFYSTANPRSSSRLPWLDSRPGRGRLSMEAAGIEPAGVGSRVLTRHQSRPLRLRRVGDSNPRAVVSLDSLTAARS